MDDFYANYIVHQYNAIFKKRILFACNCYQQYNDFIDYVFTKRNSYFCCILIVTGDGLSKIVHNSFPIMLGSEIDFTVRRQDWDGADRNMYGSFIIRGDFKLIPNFITNNLGTGHVYSKRGAEKVYIVNLKSDDHLAVHLKFGDADPTGCRFDVSVTDELYAQKKRANRLSEEEDEEGEEPPPKRRRKRGRAQINHGRPDHDRATTIRWIDIMNRCSPVPEHRFTERDYESYFDACLECAPDLDHLANKTSVSAPTIMDRALAHLIRLCEVYAYDADTKTVRTHTNKKRFTELPAKIKTVFSTGNMFFALSNKFTANVMKEFKCVYQTVDGQKLHLLSKMVSVVKRYVSDQTRNSRALKYPVDAFAFIDPINAREMKGAGETMYQSQLVLTSPESDGARVKRVLEKLTLDEGGDDQKCVVWNGFLTHYRVRVSRLAKFKRKCPFVSLMLFKDRYLNVFTKGHVLMKYSTRYECFVTPHEARHLFTDAFDGYTMHTNYSSMAMMLPKSIVRAPPAKAVVAVSNIKGRCQTIASKLALMSFLYTIGTSNAALVHEAIDEDVVLTTTLYDGGAKPVVVPIQRQDAHRRYARLAETPCDVPYELKRLFSVYKPRSDRGEQDALSYNDIVDDCERVFARVDTIYAQWLKNDHYMFYVSCPGFAQFEPADSAPLTVATCKRIAYASSDDSDAPVEILRGVPVRCASGEKLARAYAQYARIDSAARTPAHMLLYCAFGDIGGGTNEDGVILDSTFVANGPRKLVSITLALRFTEKVNVYKKEAIINDEYCKIKYVPVNRAFDTDIVIGILSSRQQLAVKRSKNVTVIESVINTHYRYLIVYKEYSEYPKTVESFYTRENSTVTMHIRYTIRLGVGSKIANVHGQKGVCSTVADLSYVSSVRDLSSYAGYRADGVRVHPQILYSTTSIIGRSVSSQVYEMLCNDTVAFTVYGEPIALMAFNVHHIEASVKARVCVTKNDLMAAENGFTANMMTNTAHCMANQNGTEHKKLFHLITQLNILNGVRLQFLDFDVDAMENVTDAAEFTESDDDDYDDD